MRLSPQQRLHFRTEGYLIVPDFFDQGMVELLREEMERLVAEDRGRNVMPAFTGKINYLITPLADKSGLFAELPTRPEVMGVVEQLLGGAAALTLDQIFLKPARVGAGNSWHLDNGRFQLADPTRGLGMWITLHEASRANGTLELIPRSHLLPPETFTPPGQHLPVPPDELLAVPMVAAAGGVIFFNFGILHCTRDNFSDNDRAALVYHFAR